MRYAITATALSALLLCGPAAAQSCSSSGLTQFTNNTPANATQVNGNFSALVNCINAIQSGGTIQSVTLAGTTSLPGGGTIASSGNIGIGTTNPGYALDVQISHGPYNSRWYNTSTAATEYNANVITGAMTSASGYFGVGGSSTGNASFRDSFVVGTSSAHTLNLNTSDTARLTILAGGNVGIGTTSPSAALDLQSGNSSYALRVFENGNASIPTFWVGGSSTINGVATGANTAGAMIYVNKDSGSARSINAAGSINSNGADYAEYFYQQNPGSLSAGLVVGLNPATGKADAARPGMRLIGIVSAKPGFVGNDLFDRKDPKNTVLVGLTGQLETRVSSEGGPINIGDSLATSSIPGVAKRAGRGDAAIGVAMTAWNGHGQGKVTILLSSANNNEAVRELTTQVVALKEQVAQQEKRLSQLESRFGVHKTAALEVGSKTPIRTAEK